MRGCRIAYSLSKIDNPGAAKLRCSGKLVYCNYPGAPLPRLASATAMPLAASPLLFFDPHSSRQREPRSSRAAANAPDRERRLICARCGNTITHQEQRIAVNGAHAHTCTNPHGLTFHIGCFREAPGCAAPGEATAKFTWFPGYVWRIADCAQCGLHLGWLFVSAADAFYGLIVDRLTARKA